MSVEDQHPVNYVCANDDEQFVQASGAAHLCRIRWIYAAMRRWWSVEKVGEAFLEILEGKEDVWLWIDGDETALPKPQWSDAGLPYAPATKALRTRQASERFESQEKAEIRHRVQSVSPAVRLAAIVWLIYTSKTMKKLDSEHGIMDREEWDLWELIWDWWWCLEDVHDQLPETSTEEFGRVIEKGHTCHTGPPGVLSTEMVGGWLYLQSVLFPERTSAAVNLMVRDYRDIDKIDCKACCNYVDQHYADRQHIFYEPSPYAVLLAIVYGCWDCPKPSFVIWIAALSSQGDYKKLMSEGQQLSESLQFNFKQPEVLDTRYALWISSYYPRSRYYMLFQHSSKTWKLVDSILGSSLSPRSSETIPNLRTWIAAATWTTCIHEQSLSPTFRVPCLNERVSTTIRQLGLAPPPLQVLHPPNTDAVKKFRRKIKNSSHTCWDGHDFKWYASVVSYLNDDDDLEFVHGPDKNWCKECSLVDHAHQFAKALSNSSHPGIKFSTLSAAMQERFHEYQQAGVDVDVVDMSISQSVSLQGTWQNNSIPPQALSVPQSTGSHSQTASYHFIDRPFITSELRHLSQNPPSYNDVSSTYYPFVSLEIASPQASDGSHQTNPPLLQHQHRTKAKRLRLKKAEMIEEVKQYIIKSLCGAGARLSKLKDKYTLPWTSLEQNLKEWRIEMINWPEDVERTDSIKGIHGLNEMEVESLWYAVHTTDPEKKLQFRRMGSAKRRADVSDGDTNLEGQSRALKNLRVNENGSQFGVWDLTQELRG